MKALYDNLSFDCSRRVTKAYSTSFSTAVKMLSPNIQSAIHSIYGFVRLADEIVDTFHDWDKEMLLNQFEKDFYESLDRGISLNPILHAFQQTVKRFHIEKSMIDDFLNSMRMDLKKKEYTTRSEYEEYIYGSADVVGLMCLKVFVHGDDKKYQALKNSAMRLGSAFQKVNFLRDLKNDTELLDRSYFPNIDLKNLNPSNKALIVEEIEKDFQEAFKGIVRLPKSSKFGVYTAFMYYKKLLNKLKKTEAHEIMESRIRVNNYTKMGLLAKSYFNIKMNLI